MVPIDIPLSHDQAAMLSTLTADPRLGRDMEKLKLAITELRVLWKAALPEPGIDEVLKVPRVTPLVPLRDQVWAVNDADGSMVHLPASTLRERGGYFFVHIADPRGVESKYRLVEHTSNMARCKRSPSLSKRPVLPCLHVHCVCCTLPPCLPSPDSLSPPVLAVITAKMQAALAAEVKAGRFIAVEKSEWTHPSQIFVNRDAQVYAIGSVFLHNQLHAVKSARTTGALLGVKVGEFLYNPLKPILATLRQPSGTGKSMLAVHVSFVLQRKRSAEHEKQIAACLQSRFEDGPHNAVVQALKQWRAHVPLPTRSIDGPPDTDRSHDDGGVHSALSAEAPPVPLTSKLVDALTHAVTVYLLCPKVCPSNPQSVSQILLSLIANELRVEIPEEVSAHTSIDGAFVAVCTQLAAWCLRQTPKRALVLVVDEYRNLLVDDDSSIGKKQYRDLMNIMEQLCLVPGLCPLLVGADTHRFLQALRHYSSPFLKQEIFMGALSVHDVEEFLQLACEPLSPGCALLLPGVARLAEALSGAGAPADDCTSPVLLASRFRCLAQHLVLATAGHARSTSMLLQVLDANQRSSACDPHEAISRAIEAAAGDAASVDDVTAVPLSIPSVLLGKAMKELAGDGGSLPEVVVELLDAQLWRVDIRERSMKTLACKMDEFSIVCGLPCIKDGTKLLLNFGAPLWRRMWSIVFTAYPSAAGESASARSPCAASLVSLLPQWQAFAASWSKNEGTAMGDPWEHVLATALGVHLSHAIRESASTSINLLDALSFMKPAVLAALGSERVLDAFSVSLLQPVRVERVPMLVVGEADTSAAAAAAAAAAAVDERTKKGKRCDFLRLLQRRQGDVMLPQRQSATQDIHVAATSALLSIAARANSRTQFTWPDLCSELAKSIPSTPERPTVILVVATRLQQKLQDYVGGLPVKAARVASLSEALGLGPLCTAFGAAESSPAVRGVEPGGVRKAPRAHSQHGGCVTEPESVREGIQQLSRPSHSSPSC
ncbi:hypothetical protein EON66_00375 [archaeon]|nr:MAG: hypothetical protein EON66_00375 [archaeon]